MGGWNQQLEHTFDVVHGSQVTMPSWMASVGGVDWRRRLGSPRLGSGPYSFGAGRGHLESIMGKDGDLGLSCRALEELVLSPLRRKKPSQSSVCGKHAKKF